MAEREIARLEGLQDGPLAKLDDFDRETASRGDIALIGDQARLILRYERDAWRRYRDAIDELKAPAPPSPSPAPKPPAPDAPPRPPAPRTPRPIDPFVPSDARIAELFLGRSLDEVDDDELDRILETMENRIGSRGIDPRAGVDLAPPERTRFAGAMA